MYICSRDGDRNRYVGWPNCCRCTVSQSEYTRHPEHISERPDPVDISYK